MTYCCIYTFRPEDPGHILSKAIGPPVSFLFLLYILALLLGIFLLPDWVVF